MLKWFKYEHLPEKLQATSKIFADAARQVMETLNPGTERTVALRKLLEAKDAAVRARIETDEKPPGIQVEMTRTSEATATITIHGAKIEHTKSTELALMSIAGMERALVTENEVVISHKAGQRAIATKAHEIIARIVGAWKC